MVVFFLGYALLKSYLSLIRLEHHYNWWDPEDSKSKSILHHIKESHLYVNTNIISFSGIEICYIGSLISFFSRFIIREQTFDTQICVVCRYVVYVYERHGDGNVFCVQKYIFEWIQSFISLLVYPGTVIELTITEYFFCIIRKQSFIFTQTILSVL